MIELLLYFEVNIISILVLAIIGLNIKFSEYRPSRRPKVLTYIICSTIGFHIFDLIGGYLRFFEIYIHPKLIYIFSAAYFLLFTIATYFLFFYSEILHNKDFIDRTKSHIILAIPLFVMFLLIVVSAFNGCIFSVTAEYGYQRGPLFSLQAMISFNYILFAELRCMYVLAKDKNSSNHLDLVTFSVYSFIMFLCEILQFVIGEFPIMIIGDTISILLLYLHYLRDMISLDSLTQIPNRRKFLYKMSEMEKSLTSNEDLYFLFIDIDTFKEINDKYGHVEGDRVLRDISHLVRKFSKKNNAICGRYGGDEFAIAKKQDKKLEFNMPQEFFKFLSHKKITTCDDTPITVSIGYSKLQPNDKTNDLISRADENMYKTKRTKKAGKTLPPPSQKNSKLKKIYA